jgi:hypothetical protein
MIQPKSLWSASWMLEQEARALLTRLARIKPFALQETMVAAAAIPQAAQTAIERYLITGRNQVRVIIYDFIRWLQSPQGLMSSPAQAQKKFTLLRLRFNASLTQFDIFADALTQRSETETGVWLSGLDVAAADALRIPGNYYDTPPVICYLDRGHGAAIRRAKTRLPGGGENPVAVIQVPRERMIGSGVASSLFHEVGHQAAALLDLTESIRPVLQELQKNKGAEKVAWSYWERCISEILADFWSVARLGITSTLGLIGVVALPGYFVFRLSLDDPHPVPWIRVKLSCAMGRALYPHRQWDDLEHLWESLYPPLGLEQEKQETLALLEKTMPELASLIVNHRPQKLRSASLAEALQVNERQPSILTAYFEKWRASPIRMKRAPPSLVFAVIGQARAEGIISPEAESQTLNVMLKHWALRSALNSSAKCAARPLVRVKRAIKKNERI